MTTPMPSVEPDPATTDRAEAAGIIVAGLRAAAAAHERVATSGVAPIAAAARAVADAVRGGHRVLAFGNGGSAADAQHFAAELVGRFGQDRPGLPAMALTSDSSVLTAVANDYGFEAVFARQIDAFGGPGDVALAISTSGQSPNVVRGLEHAAARGLTTVALTGRDGGAVGRLAAIHVNVPETATARVQEVHSTILHLICELVDVAARQD